MRTIISYYKLAPEDLPDRRAWTVSRVEKPPTGMAERNAFTTIGKAQTFRSGPLAPPSRARERWESLIANGFRFTVYGFTGWRRSTRRNHHGLATSRTLFRLLP